MADITNKKLRTMFIYQIFVRNYSEKGDFAGVECDLDRIKGLGVDIIYLLPIHPVGVEKRKGTLGSPYAISDYRSVNPEYGTLEDFIRLVDAIHEKDMKCIIDVVYNHTSPDSVLVKEHPGWFYHKTDGTLGNRVGDWSDIVDLDYTNMDLWDYQIDTLKYWAGFVDGFRCDAAPMVPVGFWEKARAEVEAVRPGCIWLAESIDPGFILQLRSEGIPAHGDAELYRAFDITYDYDIYGCLVDYLSGKAALCDYAWAVNRQEYTYPDNYVKLRFLENHDRSRAAFMIPDKQALYNFTAFLFFQKGITLVYAGQEFGAVHRPSLFDRDTVDMHPENGTDMSGLIHRLSWIKRREIFTDSSYTLITSDEDVMIASYSGRGTHLTGIFSLKGRTVHVPVMIPDGLYNDILSDEKVEIYEGALNIYGRPVIFEW